MPVDSSPYTALPTAQQDPLASVGKILQIQQGAVALQSAQQELRARQALGPILQRSIDPKTGELDTNRFFIEGSADPDVAWKMPDMVHQMLQNGQIKADTALKQMSVSKQQWEMTTGIAQGLATKAIEAATGKGKVDPVTGKWIPAVPQLSHKDIASGLADLVAAGGMDAKDAADFLARNATNSPQQNFQMIDRIMKSGQNIDQGLARLTGAIKSYNTGGEQTFTQEVPATGEVRNVGQISNTPTVESRNAGVKGINVLGQQTEQPRIQAYPMVDGAGRPIAGSPAPGSTLITGLSPNQEALQKSRAETANKYDEELNNANTIGQENLRVLREMQDAMKGFKTGGGMEVRQRLAQLAQGLGMPTKLVDEIAGGNRGALAEFQKLAVRYATQEMKTYMGGAQKFTNLDFSTFLKNNPTIDTDPRGLEKMFKFLEQGVWRVGQQQEAHQQWKSGWRPKGFENSGMDSFPAWWTKILSKVNTPEQK